MPDSANIFLIEDDAGIAQAVIPWLNNDGHVVVGMAHSVESALASIPDLGVMRVNLVMLDANLSLGEGSGAEGETIQAAIRHRYPTMPIICWSQKYYAWAEVMVRKNPLAMEELMNAIRAA